MRKRSSRLERLFGPPQVAQCIKLSREAGTRRALVEKGLEERWLAATVGPSFEHVIVVEDHELAVPGQPIEPDLGAIIARVVVAAGDLKDVARDLSQFRPFGPAHSRP